jgi:hypothetical protein
MGHCRDVFLLCIVDACLLVGLWLYFSRAVYKLRFYVTNIVVYKNEPRFHKEGYCTTESQAPENTHSHCCVCLSREVS